MAKTADIRSLTGLRGVAALIVVFYHVSYLGSAMVRSSPIGPGYLAVDLFFILSGFVMAMTYSASFMGGFTVRSYTTFMERRFARVYPVYFLLTVLVFAMHRLHILGHPAKLSGLVTNVLLLQQLGVGFIRRSLGSDVLGVSWSISTELAAYILFPLIVLVALVKGWRVSLTVGLLCCLVIIVIGVIPTPLPERGPLDKHDPATLYGVVRCLAEFTLGMLTWRIRQHSPNDRGLTGWWNAAVPITLLVAWLIPNADLLVVAMFPLLIFQLAGQTSIVSRALSSPVPFLLGELSYSVYLIHSSSLPLIGHIEPRLSHLGLPQAHLITLAILIGLDLIAAYLLFQFVERPARRWLREAFEGRRPPSILADVAAP